MHGTAKQRARVVADPQHETTSARLGRILAQLPGPDVSIGHIVAQLRRRSFGGILIILAALGLLPGISLFAGLLAIVIGLQLLSECAVVTEVRSAETGAVARPYGRSATGAASSRALRATQVAARDRLHPFCLVGLLIAALGLVSS